VISLPKLSQLDTAASTRIWLASQPADMRCSFDRLAELAASVTGDDPLSGHLFLFRSRGGDRLKILYWDTDGYALWYKRLEEGTFKLPRIEADAKSVELRASELAMMLDGIDLKSVKRVKRYRRREDSGGAPAAEKSAAGRE
jgi:transposase